jgi:dTDP-4-dehydrorhamnose reductase
MTKARVLILGSGGQLGTELVRAAPPAAEPIAYSRYEVDVTDEDALRVAVRSARPHYILNAAAYTAVDRAESEPAIAYAANTFGPRILAEECRALNAWLIHFSTDYVFDGSGTTPWKESDPTGPLNVYGRTKLEGEMAITAAGCRHLIFRTSWVYAAHGNNFLRTMIRLSRERSQLRIVNDQLGAPTSANEIARAVWKALGRINGKAGTAVEPGIYHMTCEGIASWYDFARAIFAKLEGRIPVPEILPIASAEFPTPAIRPHNSALNCEKLARIFGVRLAPWQNALEEVIDNLADQLPGA